MTTFPSRWILLAVLVGLLLRCLGVGEVFTWNQQGRLDIFVRISDSSYHARRALYTTENFPHALSRDPYLAFPDGAVVPMPPAYDWALGAGARLLGGSPRAFEWVAVLVSPVLGSLAAIPVAVLGALAGGPAVAALAAWIYAVLPAAVQWQRLGDADHHAAIAFLVASYLAAACLLSRTGQSIRRSAALAVFLAGARSALVGSWSGSLLYIGVIEGAIAAALLSTPGWSRIAVNAGGLALSAALTLALVASFPTPAAGPFTTTTLSWAHVIALATAAAVSGLVVLGEALSVPRGYGVRWLRAALIACCIGAVALTLFPRLWEGLQPGAAFLAAEDSWAAGNPEQAPLIGGLRASNIERSPFGIAHQLYGGFLYLIPLVPVAALLVARESARRGPGICLAFFACCVTPLAVLQVRYGNEFAPAAAVGFALCLDRVSRLLARGFPPRAARLARMAIFAIPFVPVAHLAYAEPVRRFVADLGFPSIAPVAKPNDIAGHSLIRFAQRIRDLTPETTGYFDADSKPEYSVLCSPGVGSVVVYAARRPVAANSFGPYLDSAKYLLVRRFFEQVTSESEAVAIAEQLGARFVLSFDYSRMSADTFAHQLHRLDGSERGGARALQHFRLLAESEPGDRPLWIDFPHGSPDHHVIPYKLFEFVAGAVVDVETAPGARISARIPLRTSSGRDFIYRQTANADARGRAQLVLPYSSERGRGDRHTTWAEAPYRLDSDDRSAVLELSEREIAGGERRRIRLPHAQ